MSGQIKYREWWTPLQFFGGDWYKAARLDAWMERQGIHIKGTVYKPEFLMELEEHRERASSKRNISTT